MKYYKIFLVGGRTILGTFSGNTCPKNIFDEYNGQHTLPFDDLEEGNIIVNIANITHIKCENPDD